MRRAGAAGSVRGSAATEDQNATSATLRRIEEARGRAGRLRGKDERISKTGQGPTFVVESIARNKIRLFKLIDAFNRV